MSLIEYALAFGAISFLLNLVNKKPKREKKMNTENPYREGYERKEESKTETPRKVFSIKGFFEVEDSDDDERILIDARRVTSIKGTDEGLTTIFYEAGTEECHYEVTDDYEVVLERFAKAINDLSFTGAQA